MTDFRTRLGQITTAARDPHLIQKTAAQTKTEVE